MPQSGRAQISTLTRTQQRGPANANHRYHTLSVLDWIDPVKPSPPSPVPCTWYFAMCTKPPPEEGQATRRGAWRGRANLRASSHLQFPRDWAGGRGKSQAELGESLSRTPLPPVSSVLGHYTASKKRPLCGTLWRAKRDSALKRARNERKKSLARGSLRLCHFISAWPFVPLCCIPAFGH